MTTNIPSAQPANNRISITSLPDLIRPAQLLAVLGVHKTTLWRWAKAGRAPKRITVGATVYFQREDVLAWLAAHKHQGVEKLDQE